MTLDFNQDRITYEVKRRKKKDKKIEKFDLNGKYNSKSIRLRVAAKSAAPTIPTTKHKK
jgi:hypothetical protein